MFPNPVIKLSIPSPTACSPQFKGRLRRSGRSVSWASGMLRISDIWRLCWLSGTSKVHRRGTCWILRSRPFRWADVISSESQSLFRRCQIFILPLPLDVLQDGVRLPVLSGIGVSVIMQSPAGCWVVEAGMKIAPPPPSQQTASVHHGPCALPK